MEFVSCDPSNYRAGRTQPVRYIVMHYTANNGDTARNNCDYYHLVGGLQASAHYFCDEYGAMQSVLECDTAWHCGARAYWHPECRNANSIGIEMCSRKRADGSYYIKPETVANAAALALALAPMVHPRRNTVFSYSECRFTCERGLVTLVSTQDGPRKTSSSMVVPP